MNRKQKGLLGGIYFIACLLIQIVLLWGFHKRMDILWLIGLALIVFAYAGASHISLDIHHSAFHSMRNLRDDHQENDPAPLLPYLFAALPLVINLILAYQFF